MVGTRPRICAAIVNEDLEPIKNVESLVDLYEVRIDMIGPGWRELVRYLRKPWLACNRRMEEGGNWQGDEKERIRELLEAVKIGAEIVDIEIGTPGIGEVVKELKGKVELIVSSHNLEETPSLEVLQKIVNNQLAAGADICKVVTMARNVSDNLVTIQLIAQNRDTRLISFAMGDNGQISRILSPLGGGYFTYASIEKGSESAPGQISVSELVEIYKLLGYM